MFAANRTPTKKKNLLVDLTSNSSPPQAEKAGPSQLAVEQPQSSNVRRSVGEWELGKGRRSTSLQPKTPSPPRRTAPALKPKQALPSQEAKSTAPKPSKYLNRRTEAKACYSIVKTNLDLSRNLKTDIKVNVGSAAGRLYELFVEACKELEALNKKGNETETTNKVVEEKENDKTEAVRVSEDEWRKSLEENNKLLRENMERMENLQEQMKKEMDTRERTTYATITAGLPRRQPHERAALHSIVVSSKDDQESGEETLGRIRNAVNAKEGGIQVDRVRKGKDGKIIVGCRTEAEREKVKERLKKAESYLHVEEMQNKDPLLILRDVLKFHSDEDVINALRNQNGNIFRNLDKQDDRVEVRYRRRARNSQVCHIVVKVSPKIWNMMTEAGEAHIDLQRVKVSDQSPLIQCSLCLGYGHGRRHCRETIEKCSHCGGPHMRAQCEDVLTGVAPSCCNCRHAKLDATEHNAFSEECAVRKKWDAMARASVAYC